MGIRRLILKLQAQSFFFLKIVLCLPEEQIWKKKHRELFYKLSIGLNLGIIKLNLHLDNPE